MNCPAWLSGVCIFVPVFLGTLLQQAPAPIEGGVNDKYEFHHHSAIEAGCTRLYKLKNSPKGVVTPVVWKYGDIVFIDCNLPPMSDKWIDPVKQTTYKPLDKTTALLFGINSDEKKNDKIKAYVPSADVKCDDTKPVAFKTFVKGEYCDKIGTMHALSISVTSEVTGSVEKPVLKYTVKQGEKATKYLMLKVTLPLDDNKKDGYFWLSANGKGTEELLRQQKFKQSKDGDFIFTIEASGGYKIVQDLLVVYSKGEKLLATTAPAYQPKE